MEKKGEKWEEEQAVRERGHHLPGAGEGGNDRAAGGTHRRCAKSSA